MSDNQLKTLSVQKREACGKGNSRRLRAKGIIPGIFYASDGSNISVQADLKSLDKMYTEVGRTTVFNLDIEGTSHPALFWDIDRDPCKNTFTHIDFYGVDLDRPIKVVVPLVFEGTAKGTKIGGVMETFREKVTLQAKPLDMPPCVVVNVSDMGLNSTIQVSDLALPEGVNAVYDVNFTIVSVMLPTADDAAADADAAAAK